MTRAAEEYPAAHSMDTTWFAVDEEGHIALFESGETGVVPEAAPRLWLKVPDLLPALDEQGAVRLPRPAPERPPEAGVEQLWSRVRERLAFYQEFHGRHPEYSGSPRVEEHLFLVLSNEETVARLAGGEGLVMRFEGGLGDGAGVTVYVASIPLALLDELLGQGVILDGWCEGDMYIEGELELAGVHVYGSPWSSVSAPYERDHAALARPLRIEEVPEGVREEIEAVRFAGIRFEDTPRIQPASHVPCEHWQAQWADVDGRVHESED